MKLHLFLVPLMLVGMLQLAGCARVAKPVPPPPPGGTYISQSAGGFFQQSVLMAKGQGNIAGLTLSGAHRPLNKPHDIYVAAGKSGIVHSSDDGGTWTIWTTPLTYASDVVALDNEIVVVSGTDAHGQGYVIRTIDKGSTWETVLTIPVPVSTGGIKIIGGNTTGSQSVVITLAPDPFRGDRLYAGTTLGNILVGDQYGKTWRTQYTLEGGLYSTNQTALGLKDIVPSPHRPGEIMVITNENKLYLVNDSEQTELKIPKSIESKSAYAQAQNLRVRSVSYIANYPKALFVGVDNGAVISRDSGKTWRKLDLPVDTVNKFNTAVVAASPTNPSRLFVGINTVIYRSEDGGESWHSFSLELKNISITSILIDPSNAANVLLVTTPVKA